MNSVPEIQLSQFGDSLSENASVPKTQLSQFGDSLSENASVSKTRLAQFGDSFSANACVPECHNLEKGTICVLKPATGYTGTLKSGSLVLC